MKENEKTIIKDLCDKKYKDKKLIVPLGWTSDGNIYYKNFKRIPGLFIAGATGTGKSIFIDDLIVSLMYKNSPEEVKFIMIDPKKMELGEYDGIKYLLGGKAKSTIKKSYDMLIFLLKILDSRVNTLNKKNYFAIDSYNLENEEKWPHIFLVIDEGSRIIKMKDSYAVFSKILEYGNRVGIHLIFSTNAYLKEYVDSKFIDKFKYQVTFDLASLEQADFMKMKDASWLKGNGEALIRGRSGEVYKIQAPYVSDEEINEIVTSNK